MSSINCDSQFIEDTVEPSCLPGINSLFIMCIRIIRNNTWVGRRARLRREPRPLSASRSTLHAAEYINHSATWAGHRTTPYKHRSTTVWNILIHKHCSVELIESRLLCKIKLLLKNIYPVSLALCGSLTLSYSHGLIKKSQNNWLQTFVATGRKTSLQNSLVHHCHSVQSLIVSLCYSSFNI